MLHPLFSLLFFALYANVMISLVALLTRGYKVSLRTALVWSTHTRHRPTVQATRGK